MNEASAIGFIGGGNMAESLVGGLCRAGTDPQSIVVCDPSGERRDMLGRRYGVRVNADNRHAAAASTCVLAVKPQVMRDALLELAAGDTGRQPFYVSIAAGITLASIERWAGGGAAVVRAMPNTPALVGCGATALCANERASAAQRDTAEKILSTSGITAWVDDESLLDVITALSGSGPAYFFLIIDALAAAAARRGLDPELARRFCTQTARGAAELAASSPDLTLEQLRRNVTSPGGTTERGIQSMQHDDVEAILDRALEAAMRRSIELAEVLGDTE